MKYIFLQFLTDCIIFRANKYKKFYLKFYINLFLKFCRERFVLRLFTLHSEQDYVHTRAAYFFLQRLLSLYLYKCTHVHTRISPRCVKCAGHVLYCTASPPFPSPCATRGDASLYPVPTEVNKFFSETW
jgi:hypothetical protein